MEKQLKKTSKALGRPAVVIAIVGALVAVTAVACGHGHGMSPKLMKRVFLGHVDDVMDDIDATDAQRATFDAVAEDILADVLSMKEAHHQQQKEMLDILSAPTPDREAIKAHIRENFDRVEELATRNVDKLMDAYETLDPEQRQIILDKLAKHMENH